MKMKPSFAFVLGPVLRAGLLIACLHAGAAMAFVQPSAPKEIKQQQTDAQSVFPDKPVVFIEIPGSTGYLGKRAGSPDLSGSQALRQLRKMFQISREKTVYVAVGSNVDMLAADLIYLALERNNEQKLPGLRLIHTGPGWQRADQLRGRIEALGAKYYVVRRDEPAIAAGED